jgi:hypothetical protein
MQQEQVLAILRAYQVSEEQEVLALCMRALAAARQEGINQQCSLVTAVATAHGGRWRDKNLEELLDDDRKILAHIEAELPHMRRRNIGKPLNYYQKHYKGIDRKNLRELDPYLCTKLGNDIRKVPLNLTFRGFPTALDYFHANEELATFSRDQLRRNDYVLWKALRDDETLKEAIPHKRRPPRGFRGYADATAYYFANIDRFRGLTRKGLQLADKSLYDSLRRTDAIEGLIPPAPRVQKPPRYRGYTSALEYFDAHAETLSELSPLELRKKEPKVYYALRKAERLDELNYKQDWRRKSIAA